MKKILCIMILFLALPSISFSAVRFVDPATDTMKVDEGFETPYIAEISTQEGVFFTRAQMEAITKIRLYYGDTEYTDSDTCAACFNWSTYKTSSKIIIDVADINWTDGSDTATLFIYSATYPSGLRVGTFPMIADGTLAVAGASPSTGIYLNDLSDVSTTGADTGDVLTRKADGTYDFETPDAGGGAGDVTGPSSATDGNLAVFDGVTGKLIKDGGAPFTWDYDYTDLINKPTLFDGAYSSLSGIPSSFTPATHGNEAHSVSYLDAEVDGSTTNEINTITGDDSNTTSGLGITIAGAGTVATSVSGDTVTITGTSIGHYNLTIPIPSSQYANSIYIPIDPKTSAAKTATAIELSCEADPTTELDADLMQADALIGMANAAILQALDTTNGVLSLSSQSISIGSGKAVYLRFNAEPDAAIKWISLKVTYE